MPFCDLGILSSSGLHFTRFGRFNSAFVSLSVHPRWSSALDWGGCMWARGSSSVAGMVVHMPHCLHTLDPFVASTAFEVVAYSYVCIGASFLIPLSHTALCRLLVKSKCEWAMIGIRLGYCPCYYGCHHPCTFALDKQSAVYTTSSVL